jgi:hypothetical protein
VFSELWISEERPKREKGSRVAAAVEEELAARVAGSFYRGSGTCSSVPSIRWRMWLRSMYCRTEVEGDLGS